MKRLTTADSLSSLVRDAELAGHYSISIASLKAFLKRNCGNCGWNKGNGHCKFFSALQQNMCKLENHRDWIEKRWWE